MPPAALRPRSPEREINKRVKGNSTHELVASTLRRAGIAGRKGIRPNSVPAWRGAKELDDGATIDEVTLLLGMRSLDRAAFFIGFDWKDGA
jgi:hypothetical protein